MYPDAHKQAKQAPCRTKSISLSKRQPAFKTAPHAPRFTTAKKLNSPARKSFKTRHNIYEATSDKTEWIALDNDSCL